MAGIWVPDEADASVTFKLAEDKKRATITPRDAASLALWALMPLTHPLCVEPPRWCFVNHKHRVRHALVIHVDGLTTEDVLRASWAPAGSVDAVTAAHENLSSAAPEAAAPLDNVWLAAIRRLGASVQFAPLWVNNTMGRLDAEFFLRQDRKHQAMRLATATARSGDETTSGTTSGPAPAVSGAASGGRGGGGGGMTKASTVLAWAIRQAKRSAQQDEQQAAAAAAAQQEAVAATNGDGSDEVHSTPCASPPPDAAGPYSPDGPQARIHAALEEDRRRTAAAAAAASPATRKVMSVEIPPMTLQDWDVPTEKLAAFAMTRQELLDHGFQLDASHLRPLPADAADGNGFERAVAVDCEMVLGAAQRSMLARVSVIRVPTGEVLLDAIVKPSEPVADYLTRYSGITEEMLASPDAVPFETAQAMVSKMISRETFIVGHGLENDFGALQLAPSDLPRVLDTTMLYPHPNGLPNKQALRYLAFNFLGGRRIQTGNDGHDSVEDASVCVELVGLKLRNGHDYGLPARVNIAALLAAEHKTEPAPSWEPPVISIVERSEVMRRVATRNCNTIVARNDSDAARKVASTFSRLKPHQRSFVYTRLREVAPEEEEEGAGPAEGTVGNLDESQQADESTDSAVAAPPTTRRRLESADGAAAAAATKDEPPQPWAPAVSLNVRLARMVNAAPAETIVVVMAAVCPTDSSPNRHASSHGTVFAFVKTTATPRLPEEREAYLPTKPLDAAASAGCAQS
jgi:DNA polymerase III epsilon subunit-like protein